MLKTCCRCKEAKPVAEFHKDKRQKDGLRPYCAPCAKELMTEWRTKYPGRAQAKNREAYQRRKARNMAAHGKAVDVTIGGIPHREYFRWRNAHHDFGLTREEYEALPKFCLICGATKALHIDHCHETGRVRGRLCRNCNFGLGNFRDDPSLLLRAIQYLRA